MALTPHKTARLIAKYLKNELSPEEATLLEEHLREKEEDRLLLESFKNTGEVQAEIDYIADIDVEAAWKRTKYRKQRSKLWSSMKWIAAAAIIIFGVVILSPILLKKDEGVIADATGKYKNDVLPGSNKAELLLSDGSVIYLNDDINQLQEKDGTSITGGGGEIKYAHSGKSDGQRLFNTLKVPKAGTYRISLADGTKVWLNALSEIYFPVQFDKNERKVSVKGEAYFEVKKDANSPFRVEVDGSTIEVLGTHFNVNAYDSQSATTLLEGKVRVSHRHQQQVLQPGQVANIVNDHIYVNPADIVKATAWKDEIFLFKEDRMDYILKQLSLWYDLEISSDGAQPDGRFSGSVKRNAKLSEVLEMLNFISGASFEIENRNLHVKY